MLARLKYFFKGLGEAIADVFRRPPLTIEDYREDLRRDMRALGGDWEELMKDFPWKRTITQEITTEVGYIGSKVVVRTLDRETGETVTELQFDVATAREIAEKIVRTADQAEKNQEAL